MTAALYAALISLISSIFLAWITGDVRKYGHRLERLSDLAAKVPERCTEARKGLEDAVETEAARLLAKPARVRIAEWFLGVFALLSAPGLVVWTYVHFWGMSEQEARSSVLQALGALVILVPLTIVVVHRLNRWLERRAAYLGRHHSIDGYDDEDDSDSAAS